MTAPSDDGLKTASVFLRSFTVIGMIGIVFFIPFCLMSGVMAGVVLSIALILPFISCLLSFSASGAEPDHSGRMVMIILNSLLLLGIVVFFINTGWLSSSDGMFIFTVVVAPIAVNLLLLIIMCGMDSTENPSVVGRPAPGKELIRDSNDSDYLGG
ncbi:MAG: hypothetical protein LBJ14_02570 [Desulfarculales bacterium]|jgi:hypothetical protein|nr:hypothetical protein [Desulfarculales bacterium]